MRDILQQFLLYWLFYQMWLSCHPYFVLTKEVIMLSPDKKAEILTALGKLGYDVISMQDNRAANPGAVSPAPEQLTLVIQTPAVSA